MVCFVIPILGAAFIHRLIYTKTYNISLPAAEDARHQFFEHGMVLSEIIKDAGFI